MKVMFQSLAIIPLILVSTYTHATVQTVLGKDQFNQVVLQSAKPVVVKFGAPWCPACTRSKAPYHKVSDDADLAHVTFVDMDFDTNSAVAQQYDVQSLPTFLYFNNGKLAATKTGFSENLKNEIANTVANLGAGAPQAEVKKNEEAQPTAQANQEEVNGPACGAGSDHGFLQNTLNGISNFFNSVWNALTGWFK
ncbi:hypothetical protein BH09DEP1_BH09DEP1_3510 [soil metagenome]